MPRLRLDGQSTNVVSNRFCLSVCYNDLKHCHDQIMEPRGNTLKSRTVGGQVNQKLQGPSLRPRAVLGDLTKVNASSSNQVKGDNLGDEKLKKAVLGNPIIRKPLQNVTSYVL